MSQEKVLSAFLFCKKGQNALAGVEDNVFINVFKAGKKNI